MPKFLTDPIPHTEGADFIRNKPAVTRRVFDQLAPELQARAFMITGIEALDVVARVRDLAGQLPVGGDFKDLKGQILDELSPWLVTSTDPDERSKQEGAAHRRAELLLRMHGWQAYARTQHALMEEHADVFPFRKYLSSEDNRVRPSHAALDKKILPASHPFWINHTPPWEFGCRCDCVPMTAEEVGEISAAESHKPPEDMEVVPPAILQDIESNQRLVKKGAAGYLDLRTPRERLGTGYEWRPGEDSLSIDQILARFPAADRQVFEDFAARQRLDDGRTLLDWWKNGRAPTPAPAPAVVPPAPRPVVAVVPPVSGNRSAKPVSDALDVVVRSKAEVRRTIAAIDLVHDDGVLPKIPVNGKVGKRAAGHFRAFDGGAPVEIAIMATGPWKHMTTAHEIGHFLDHSAIGTPGKMDSEDPNGVLSSVIRLLKGTPTVQSIPTFSGDPYYLRNRELWARAYAQFIAEESAVPELLADLQKTRTSLRPWLQWPSAEFAPIRAEIRSTFTQLQWNLKASPPAP